MTPRPLVAVIDDDESVRESLPDELRELGYDALPFRSAEEFLASGCISEAACLVLDVAMPGISGPQLQLELLQRGHDVPVIFITAFADRCIPPDLLARGAIACLSKPFQEKELRDALEAALSQPRAD